MAHTGLFFSVCRLSWQLAQNHRIMSTWGSRRFLGQTLSGFASCLGHFALNQRLMASVSFNEIGSLSFSFVSSTCLWTSLTCVYWRSGWPPPIEPDPHLCTIDAQKKELISPPPPSGGWGRVHSLSFDLVLTGAQRSSLNQAVSVSFALQQMFFIFLLIFNLHFTHVALFKMMCLKIKQWSPQIPLFICGPLSVLVV